MASNEFEGILPNGTEYEKQANSKTDVSKAFRKMSDGSDDCRKWLIDEQLSIHKDKKGNKEAFIEKNEKKRLESNANCNKRKWKY